MAAFLSLLALSAQEMPSPSVPPIQAGCEVDYPPFCIVHGDGSADGFSVELMREALARMGRDVTFRPGRWAEVRGWLERGEIDALPLVGRTPERETLFDFTVPYLTMHGAIVVRDSTTDIHSILDLRGRRVGVMEGDNAEEFLRRDNRGLEIVTTPTFTEALQALADGRCDAVVIQRLVALRLLDESAFDHLHIIDRPIMDLAQAFCFAVREGDRDTLALLNEGLALVVADGTHRRLHAKWFAAHQLPSDRPIVVGGDHNYPPFEFLDEKGRPTGYNVDLVRSVADAVGLDIRIRLGPWSEMMNALERGEIDVMQGMFYSPERDRDFDFSQAHIVNHCVSVVRADTGDPPSTAQDLEGRRLVVQDGDIMHDFCVSHGLTDRLTTVDAQEDALRDVAHGKRDCALVSRMTAFYWIEREGWDNLVVGRTPLASPQYCFAVPSGNRALLAQFSEGLTAIADSEDYRRIHEKWMGVYADHYRWRDVLMYVLMVAGPLLLIAIFALLWSWGLRRQVAARTRDLRESLDRFQAMFEAANVGKSMTLPSGEITVNKAFADMLGYTPAELQGKRWQALTLPEDVPESERRIAPLIDGRESATRFEKRYVRRDGEIVWTDISVTIRRDEHHRPLHFVTTVVDITERKRAEDALQASTEYQRAMIACSPVALYSVDMDGDVLTWNEASERVFGWSASDVIGKPLPIVPEAREEEFDALKERVASGQSFTGQELIRCRKDGTLIPISLSVAAVHDEKGRIIGIMGAAEDISDRKQREAEIASQQRLLRAAADTARFGGWSVNLETGTVMWSELVCDLHGVPRGYSPDVADGIAFYAPEWRERITEVFTACAESGVPYDEEMEIIDTDGRRLWVRTVGQAVTDEGGRIVSVEGSFQDISAHKEREHALRESELRLMEAQRLASIGHWSWEFGTGDLFLSDQMYSIIGLQRTAEALDVAAHERHYTPASWRRFMDSVKIARETGESYEIELEVIREDGANRHVVARGECVRDDHGDVVSLHGTLQDVTDRVSLQRQLTQAQKMESVGRLAGGVAHDFNNLLMGIMNYVELCRDGIDPDHPVREWLDEITAEAQRSANLTRQLLAFARKQTIAPKVLDLNDAVEGMLKMLRRLIGEDIDLAWQPGSDLWPVQVDPGQVDQILANLCVNARDAIGGVGNVTLETANATIDADYCAEHVEARPGGFVMLAVSDNGCGMDRETLEHVFEPFFTTKPTGEGTGLGLATVYGIVKQNGGEVNVYSEPGEGTTFRIYLPRYGGDEAVGADTGRVSERVGGGETILLVEDERSVRITMALFLERLGYTVLTAETPAAALQTVAGHEGPIHLLITDVVMPGMSGRDLAARLVRDYGRMKCLFISGYTANVIAHRGILDADVEFLAKPFSRDDVVRKVRGVLDA